MIIVEKFYKLLKENENHILYVDENNSFSVKDAETLSGKVYNYLTNNNIKKEDFVLIKLDRSAVIYPIIIGVIKAGCAYTIIEKEMPSNRIEHIINDINPKLIIDKNVLNEIEKYDYREGNVETNIHDAAYAVYTSGTTGKPKRIIHEYGIYEKAIKSSLIDGSLLQKQDSRFALLCPLNFIVAIYTFPCSIYSGGTIYIPKYQTIKNYNELINYFENNKINEIFMTPSYLAVLKDKLPNTIRLVITGSDVISNISLKKARLFNFYMMSESGFVISKYEITKDEAITPIGKPNEYVDTKINKDDEILIKNEFLRSDLKDKDDYFNTHDLVCVDKDKNYIIKGRSNDMIKVNGNRVEPLEIEIVLKKITGSDFVVKCFDEKIVAYYSSNEIIDEKKLRNKLNDELPYYMIPTLYYKIDSFPLTEMGKIDKKKLSYPSFAKEKYEKPSTEFEIKLVKTLKKHFINEEIGINDDLFKYGLDSIKIIDLISKVKIPGLEAKHFYEGRTVKDIGILYEQDSNILLTEKQKEEIGRKTEFTMIEGKCYRAAMLNINYVPTTVYNLPVAYRLKSINIEKLKDVLNTYLSESSLFNTKIYLKGGQPYQKYVDDLFDPIEIEEKTKEEVDELKKNFIKPFVLNEEKPYRIRLIKYKKETYLFFDMHHVLIDGLGLNLIFKDIFSLYFNKKTNYTSNYFAYLYDLDRTFKTEKVKKAILNDELNYKKDEYISTYQNDEDNNEIGYHFVNSKTDIPLIKINKYLVLHSITRTILFNAVQLLTLNRLTSKNKIRSYYIYSNRTGNNNHTGYRASAHSVIFNFDNYQDIDCLYKEIKRQIDDSLQYPDINVYFDLNGFKTGIALDDLEDIQTIPKELKNIIVPIELDNPFSASNTSPLITKYLRIMNEDDFLMLSFGCDEHYMSNKQQQEYLDTFIEVLKEILANRNYWLKTC